MLVDRQRWLACWVLLIALCLGCAQRETEELGHGLFLRSTARTFLGHQRTTRSLYRRGALGIPRLISENVGSVSVSQDGRRVAFIAKNGSLQSLNLWDRESSETVEVAVGDFLGVRDNMSRDGERLAYQVPFGPVVLYDVTTGERTEIAVPDYRLLSVSPDGERLALGRNGRIQEKNGLFEFVVTTGEIFQVAEKVGLWRANDFTWEQDGGQSRIVVREERPGDD